ncbi:glycosyltransferase [Pasteuria penetrans]|uniref:glycosyltransferase n=1 Tax=Pasteuria penetrans TaxID=86005 RepID=UPI000FA35555|nr:glycosyltransferase [Pasteuria penetrans]
MITVSLCMIVRDEEKTLARCLDGVQDFVDEMIVVDTGSKDRTRDIAEQYGAKIYEFPWCDHFADARNFAFSKATQEYIFWVDADDIIESADLVKLQELKKVLPVTVDSVAMLYHLSIDNRGRPSVSLRRNRLVRRDRGFRWHGPVHEYLAVSGNIIQSDIGIYHKKEKSYTDRNLRIYRSRDEKGEDFNPRDLYYFANELRDHGFYEESVVYYLRFLNTQQGWVEDNVEACMKMSECYGYLRERLPEFDCLVRSFLYDKPRAEVCCRIGLFFFQSRQLLQAIFWYTLATQLGDPPATMGTQDQSAWTWLPHLQLCLCYDQLGDVEKAEEHNNRAMVYNPLHPSILHNQQYFAGKREAAREGKRTASPFMIPPEIGPGAPREVPSTLKKSSNSKNSDMNEVDPVCSHKEKCDSQKDHSNNSRDMNSGGEKPLEDPEGFLQRVTGEWQMGKEDTGGYLKEGLKSSKEWLAGQLPWRRKSEDVTGAEGSGGNVVKVEPGVSVVKEDAVRVEPDALEGRGPTGGNKGGRRPATWEQVQKALAEARKAILRTDREDSGERFSRVQAEWMKGEETADVSVSPPSTGGIPSGRDRPGISSSEPSDREGGSVEEGDAVLDHAMSEGSVPTPKSSESAEKSIAGCLPRGEASRGITEGDVFIPSSGEAVPVAHRTERSQRSNSSRKLKQKAVSNRKGKRKRR